MNQSYKCLIPLAMFYMTIKLMTVLLIYKLIKIGPISISVSSLIIPVWFLTGDIIAEIYGYHISKKLIWTALICQFIFAFICAAVIKLPSPPHWMYQADYEHIVGNFPRVVLASFLAILCGALINARIISKWKVLLNGRFFG